MQNLTYLAVFEPSTDGSYSIYFPDLPGCISVGNNLEEAARMAAEAASLHVYSMECDYEEIPTPSVNLSKEDTEGNVVMPVTIHPDLFRMKKDNERIKTNITLYLLWRGSRMEWGFPHCHIPYCKHGGLRLLLPCVQLLPDYFQH